MKVSYCVFMSMLSIALGITSSSVGVGRIRCQSQQTLVLAEASVCMRMYSSGSTEHYPWHHLKPATGTGHQQKSWSFQHLFDERCQRDYCIYCTSPCHMFREVCSGTMFLLSCRRSAHVKQTLWHSSRYTKVVLVHMKLVQYISLIVALRRLRTTWVGSHTKSHH